MADNKKNPSEHLLLGIEQVIELFKKVSDPAKKMLFAIDGQYYTCNGFSVSMCYVVRLHLERITPAVFLDTMEESIFDASFRDALSFLRKQNIKQGWRTYVQTEFGTDAVLFNKVFEVPEDNYALLIGTEKWDKYRD